MNPVTSTEVPIWQVLRRPAILPDGSLWFPSRLTHAYLADRKSKIGPYLFSAQYMLESIAPEDRKFEEPWLVYTPINLVAAEGHVYIDVAHGGLIPVSITLTVDPALSQTQGGDFTGLVVVACDSMEIWYVLEAKRVKMNAHKLIDEIVAMVRIWQVSTVGIEVVAYQAALQEFLEPRLEEEGLRVYVEPLKTGSGRGKNARIEGLIPRFAAGNVYVRKGVGPELEHELLNWHPRKVMRHDDLIDALSHQAGLAIPPSPLGQRTLGPDLFDLSPDERRKLREKKARLEGSLGRPWTGY